MAPRRQHATASPRQGDSRLESSKSCAVRRKCPTRSPYSTVRWSTKAASASPVSGALLTASSSDPFNLPPFSLETLPCSCSLLSCSWVGPQTDRKSITVIEIGFPVSSGRGVCRGWDMLDDIDIRAIASAIRGAKGRCPTCRIWPDPEHGIPGCECHPAAREAVARVRQEGSHDSSGNVNPW